MSIRVVLGEDNVLVREGVRALLDSYEDVEVVGVAADAPSLLSAAEEHTPDVVVTDIKMPPNFQLEGIDCAHAIRETHPGTGVVVLSAHDDEAYAIALLGKGQSGLAYLLKDRIAQGDELVRAIREVAAGGSAVDPLIAERLSGRRETGEHDRELLELMSQGLGYEQMAENLGTTPEAVDRRVTQLFTRMAAQAEGGGAAAVDEMKRLHAAVVEKQATATAFRSFVPEQVAAKLQASGSTELREELEATILFSDIRGYSTLAEHLAPAQVAELVGGHLAAMAEVIIRHGGMVDQFVGDAVMAVFGAPEPSDDHAARAVGCALAMQARQAELNAGVEVDGRAPIAMGIGINTGRVMAGTVGGGGRLEYTVVGDAVNIAARLQGEAAGGEIVASATTIAAAGAIAAEPIGARQVKGREEPVEVYRVVVR
ncbi:MAG: response regulator [Actinobacteria bacterium]|nr:response regulator [Actinomycetota bacterium]